MPEWLFNMHIDHNYTEHEAQQSSDVKDLICRSFVQTSDAQVLEEDAAPRLSTGGFEGALCKASLTPPAGDASCSWHFVERR